METLVFAPVTCVVTRKDALLYAVSPGLGKDPARMAALSLRFSAPAFPGDTIRPEIWRDGPRALFRCPAVERDVPIATDGILNLREGLAS